ncbi:MAG: hypothetical protein ACYCXX_11340 [Acidiferrobacter thiooxydans]
MRNIKSVLKNTIHGLHVYLPYVAISVTIVVFGLLWLSTSLHVAINFLVAVGTIGMAYFSFTLNRQTVRTERRRIKPLCHCTPIGARAHFPQTGVAPKAFFYQHRDGKEINDRSPDIPLSFSAQIDNSGVGPACKVSLCLGSARQGLWTARVSVAAVIAAGTGMEFHYSFSDTNIPCSEIREWPSGEPGPLRGHIQDLYGNVDTIYLQYSDIEGNVYHSSLCCLTDAVSIQASDAEKFRSTTPMTTFASGPIAAPPWYRYEMPPSAWQAINPEALTSGFPYPL